MCSVTKAMVKLKFLTLLSLLIDADGIVAFCVFVASKLLIFEDAVAICISFPNKYVCKCIAIDIIISKVLLIMLCFVRNKIC